MVTMVHKYHMTNNSSPGLNNVLGDNLHDGGLRCLGILAMMKHSFAI